MRALTYTDAFTKTLFKYLNTNEKKNIYLKEKKIICT